MDNYFMSFKEAKCGLADQVMMIRNKKPTMYFSKIYISIATMNIHGPNTPQLGLFKLIKKALKKEKKRTALKDSQAVSRWRFNSIQFKESLIIQLLLRSKLFLKTQGQKGKTRRNLEQDQGGSAAAGQPFTTHHKHVHACDTFTKRT